MQGIRQRLKYKQYYNLGNRNEGHGNGKMKERKPTQQWILESYHVQLATAQPHKNL
jgi:hypothetical protein